LNIFRFILHIEKKGYKCRVVIVGHPQPVSASQARREINEWFFPLEANVYLQGEALPAAHYSIATEWRTAYWVRNFPATVQRCYFVQDFEPWFFPMGSEYVLAEQTYQFGFTGITAGQWLEGKLAQEYGMETHSVGFSYDKDLYKLRETEKNQSQAVRRVLFYARPPTPRRAFELGLLVLHEVSKRLNNVEVIFAGWDVSDYEIPFFHRNAGLLDLDSLPALYSECDVALVISLSNLSLLPLELMACGVPVVSNRAPCTEWLLNSDNAHLAPPTVEGLAQAVCEVLEQPDLAKRLYVGGIAAANQTDWEAEADRFANILESINTSPVHNAEKVS
jgi:glycosyltransferase involved in cell wall biosynthesis